MDIQIIEKGVELAVKDKSGQSFTKLYVGAGWDFDGDKKVDLDLVALALANGKLTNQTRIVYFGDKTEPGITLGADNRSGEGDGDDESIVFDLEKVEADVDSIPLFVVAYSGADLSTAKNVHFRVVNGQAANDTQVFDVKATDAQAGDTVLHAATLKRVTDGWTIENVSEFTKHGNGAGAISAIAQKYAA